MAISTTGFTLSNHIPLRITSGSALSGGMGNAYQNIINGNNLVRKSAQLVNDIEGLRNAPKTLESLKIQSSASPQTLEQAGLASALPEISFQSFVDQIKEQLSKGDKPYTLLNVVKAQQELFAKSANEDKSVDKKV